MTMYPTFLDRLAAALLATAPPQENPHHRALLDTYISVQLLDQELLGLADPGRTPTGDPEDELDALIDLLEERLAAGSELARLLSAECCCAEEAAQEPEEEESQADCRSCPDAYAAPATIIHAALEVFAECGDPDAMSSADLVTALRGLPGVAEGRWRYSELTQTRLAQLLARYEISTRDATLADGRRRKSYRRAALRAALQSRSC